MKVFLMILLAAMSAAARGGQALILIEGDSLFSGNNGVANWTSFFSSPGASIINHAESGKPLRNIYNEYFKADYLPRARDWPSSAPERFFILEGGHGDLNSLGAGAEDIFARASQILELARRDGCRTMLCTVPASPFLRGQKEIERQKYNVMVRECAPCTADMVLDLDILIPPDPPFRQPDGLHFTVEAERLIAERKRVAH